MVSLKKLCEGALKAGIKEAKVIKTETIVIAPWVRIKCQYGCPVYGQRLSCPPFSPSPEETQKIINTFEWGILLHLPSFSEKIRKIVVELEKEAFLAGYYKSFGLGCGPCHLCSSCNVEAGCQYPEKARPSMEACGIDVFQTVRNNGFKIEVVNEKNCQENYFGLLLVK
jgi:predicted metal-binding protein